MRNYSSVFATPGHMVITRVDQIKNYDTVMGFFLNGKEIGTGELARVRIGKREKIVHTAATGLNKKYRRKGHGIHLYIALIETARSIGATQIRSDTRLNKFSRRMWKEKLPRIYPVKTAVSRTGCTRCGHKPSWHYFYINLED